MYLTEDQRRLIDQITCAEGITLAEVVRRALDTYLTGDYIDAGRALAETFGADPGVVHADRGEWEDRG